MKREPPPNRTPFDGKTLFTQPWQRWFELMGAIPLQGVTGIAGINGTNGHDGLNGIQGMTGLQGIQGVTGMTAPISNLIAIDLVTWPPFAYVSLDAIADLTDPSTVIIWTPGQRNIGELLLNLEYVLVGNSIQLTDGTFGTRNWLNTVQANSLGLLSATIYQAI